MDYINKQVKILLNNNIVIEGIVLSWDKEVCLKSLDGKSTSVIMRPDDHICVIKVIEQSQQEEQNIKEDIVNNNIIVNESLKQKINDAVALPIEDDLRLKTIAELKKELNKNEKQAIANKLKSNVLTENQNIVRYQYPPFILKK